MRLKGLIYLIFNGMKITWYGQSCFKLQNNQEIVIIDPRGPKKVGLKGPSLKATIFILTDPDDKKVLEIKDGMIINSPGEYEVKGIMVYGIDCSRKNKNLIIYQVEIDKIKYGFLGEINTQLKSEELEHLDGIDVLFVPVGGKDALNADKAVEIINSVEPKIVIPCCYKSASWQTKIKTNIGTLDEFLKEMGVKKVEKLEKLLLNKKDLPTEETKVIILEPKI
ncbi:MAG: MBL fold metallo-hydrolase [Patescibacteria group bacterium]|nr:MBL fold metallo-hydrolase [Patescibacteria group bacterium]